MTTTSNLSQVLYEVACRHNRSGRVAFVYIWECDADVAKSRVESQMSAEQLDVFVNVLDELPDQFLVSNFEGDGWQEVCDYLGSRCDVPPGVVMSDDCLPVLEWMDLDDGRFALLADDPMLPGDDGWHIWKVVEDEESKECEMWYLWTKWGDGVAPWSLGKRGSHVEADLFCRNHARALGL